MNRYLLFFLFLGLGLKAQMPLSSEAQISLITCGPGQNELYSAFGHTAVRVKDPKMRLDLVFNYGIFDFNQPNFYLNFAKGHLLYMLAVSDWDRFERAYINEGRFIHEQVLNLDSAQTKAYFEFLMDNARPENKDYYYDYFYDNCATRVRDGLETSLGAGKIKFLEETYYQPSLSIRELCDEYLVYQPWGDLGIDLCLGQPMDKQADARIEMFLPDLLEYAFAKAVIIEDGVERPLVKSFKVLYPATAVNQKSWWSPMFFFAVCLVLVVLATIFFYQQWRILRYLDVVLFSVSGILGIFLLILWFFTDHKAAAYNFNILIFLPLNIFLIPGIIRGKWAAWSLEILRYLPYFYAILLAAWAFLPQQLHLGLLPLVAILILRSWHIYRKYPRH